MKPKFYQGIVPLDKSLLKEIKTTEETIPDTGRWFCSGCGKYLRSRRHVLVARHKSFGSARFCCQECYTDTEDHLTRFMMKGNV